VDGTCSTHVEVRNAYKILFEEAVKEDTAWED